MWRMRNIFKIFHSPLKKFRASVCSVRLGTDKAPISNPYQATYSSHMDRSYDSEDEHTGRRRLRQTHSTELQPRTSVYSRGDIREQVSDCPLRLAMHH